MTRSSLSPELQAQTLGSAALLALAALGLGWRLALPRASAAEPIVVEVRGEVPAPGFYALQAPATVADAVAAAGGRAGAGAEAPVRHGDRVAPGPEGVLRARTEAALILGEKLSLNEASAAALEGLPGVGARRAADIVADRAARGPYPSVDALDRVRGIGPATVERLRPFLEVEVVTR